MINFLGLARYRAQVEKNSTCLYAHYQYSQTMLASNTRLAKAKDCYAF